MKKISFLILLLFLSISSDLFAQVPREISKRDIKIKAKKKEFKKIWRKFQTADELFLLSRVRHKEALELYLKVNKYKNDIPRLHYRIGICYFQTIEKEKVIEFLEKAYQKDNDVAIDILYQLGRAYHINYKFDKAIEYYQKFSEKTIPPDLANFILSPEKLIKECKVGKELTKNPLRVFIDNLGDGINSPYPDYSPVISTDEQVLIFTSRRDNSTGGMRTELDEGFYEDLYISYNIDGKWTTAANMNKPINTDGHDATVSLSPDGEVLFIYDGQTGNGDLFFSQKDGDGWSEPKKLRGKINTKYHEPSASLAPDWLTMYFVSDRKKGKGGHDIYISKRETLDDKFGKPVNIGDVINTPYDEVGVFIHPDGKTLYFSSKGHNTMGGFDIFKSVKDEDGKWSVPENLGYPVNTPEDDVFFVISGSGKHGYFSSVKEGGYGNNDIYMITFLGAEKPVIQSNEDNLIACISQPIKEVVVEKPVEINTTNLTILKGTVRDSITKEPLFSNIEIVDNEKNEIVATINSNKKTGKYLVPLPSGKNYGIAVKANTYLFHSENFDIPKASGYQEFVKDVELLKLIKGAKIILKNIFFDTAKWSLRKESTAELNRLIKLLNDYPTLKIKILGHTDNVGSLAYNTNLSNNRSKAVVDYLIKAGISKDRLKYEGFAFKVPIATNKTKEGRQLNRRVEFEVLSI